MESALLPVRNVWLLIAIGVVAIVPLEAFTSGWWHVGGVVLILVAIAVAVDELQNAAMVRLSASEARLRLQLRRMPIGCMTIDRDRMITSWNEAAERIFGWTADEAIGRSGAILLSGGGFTQELDDLVDSVLRGDVVDRHTNENVTKDGRTIVCRWMNAPLMENGEVIGILSMAEDVTEEQAIENELRETRARHRNLLDALPHYIFSVDNDDRYVALNAHSCRYFGLSEEEIIGHTAEELGIPPEVARPWHEINAITRESGGSQTRDLVISGREPRYERVITEPVRNHRGEIIGVTGVSIDMTETKRAEEAQRRLDEQMAHLSKMEALGTLAGGISHDFNNILSIILTHATILNRRCPEPALQRSIGAIQQAVDRGATISRQILTFARRAEVRAGPVDVGDVLSDLYTLVAETFPRTIRMQVARDPALPPISGDAGQIQQALLNLCINARDAMPDGGVLSIEARLAGDRVLITVSDEGFGLDEETRRRIFEPFFTTKERAKGMGLGLPMVYGIVRAHGGWIEVESEPGFGTTFRLYFPVATSAATESEAVKPAERVRGERLLVIDDEASILAGLELQLIEAGYLVQTAQSGPEAIENFQESPDLVLMDLGMPGMGAADLIEALRALAPGLRIIAMTGYVDPEVHAAVRVAGVKHILQKPFAMGELLECIDEVLHKTDV